MIGRKEERQFINELYKSNTFEYLVLYGIKSVGKTTLLKNFIKDKSAIYYPANKAKNSLVEMNKLIHQNRPSWDEIFISIGDITNKRQILIIDDFDELIKSNPSIVSIFQHAIDHYMKNFNVLLILAGEKEIMKEKVLSYLSPLYARQSATLELKPFNYLESSLFLENCSAFEKIQANHLTEGIPLYLETIQKENLSPINKKDLKPMMLEILKQYVYIKAKDRLLPFIPYHINYKNDYVLAFDKLKQKVMIIVYILDDDNFAISKYNYFIKELNEYKETYLYSVSKSGYTESVIKQAKQDNIILLTIDDLFL